MIDFQYYLFLAITLVANAFCTGVGVSLGAYFVNKNIVKRQEQNIDEIVEKVLEKLKENIPKEIDDD